ncbi:hypothetical protein [Vibrio sp. Y2-5]|uniref:hypothetical protein n=1 Tax=Vibrio sp. Y2-5 TaxID=2743977 RepID=UPI001CB72748|nr:hypothetical protein [Vibrio sp. Y2-5]
MTPHGRPSFSDEGIKSLNELGYNTEKLLAIFEYLLNESIRNKPEDMLITMHICRGNFRSTYFGSGGYEASAETIFGQLKVDGLFLEYNDERSGGFEPLKYVTRNDLFIVLGIVTSKSPELEPKEYLKSRIQEATKYISLEQLRLSPQCGFASKEEGNILKNRSNGTNSNTLLKLQRKFWGILRSKE